MTVKCNNCNGKGTSFDKTADAFPETCPMCEGAGKIKGVCSSCYGQGYFVAKEGYMLGTCAKCNGTGKENCV